MARARFIEKINAPPKVFHIEEGLAAALVGVTLMVGTLFGALSLALFGNAIVMIVTTPALIVLTAPPLMLACGKNPRLIATINARLFTRAPKPTSAPDKAWIHYDP